MAGLVGIRAEDMDQVDALRRAKLDWPQGLPFIRPSVRAPDEDGLAAYKAKGHIAKRKKGDWSAIETQGQPVTSGYLQKPAAEKPKQARLGGVSGRRAPTSPGARLLTSSCPSASEAPRSRPPPAPRPPRPQG